MLQQRVKISQISVKSRSNYFFHFLSKRQKYLNSFSKVFRCYHILFTILYGPYYYIYYIFNYNDYQFGHLMSSRISKKYSWMNHDCSRKRNFTSPLLINDIQKCTKNGTNLHEKCIKLGQATETLFPFVLLSNSHYITSIFFTFSLEFKVLTAEVYSPSTLSLK